MIVFSNYNDPYQNIIFDNGEVKIIKLKDYKGEYDQGIASFVGKNNDVLGLFTQDGILYLLKNGQIVNLNDKQVECTDYMKDGIRKFDLKINGNNFYNCEYEPVISMEDMILGDDELDYDFLLKLSSILSSQDNIDKFMTGFTVKKR